MNFLHITRAEGRLTGIPVKRPSALYS